MADVNANIRVGIDAAEALAQLKALEKQIQYFNKSIVQGSSEAARLQGDFTSSLLHNINATGKFTASMGKVMTETERFTNALEKNKLSAREYFRYSMASTKTFGRMFGKEFGIISKTAEDRVRLLQTRHIELGRAADGAMRAVKIVPNTLDYSKPLTQMQLAIQKQQIFNQLLDTGTTKLLNFGKNTQWAGRQLMVGFTIPLSILGGVAIRTFQDIEKQAIRFKKVYGDMFTATSETDAALANIKQLAEEFTKYGVSIADTISLAADAAAAGSAGKELENVVTQATKLSVLGGVAQEQAFDATIAIQNAFKVTGKELDNTINFLNAVENQTVLALEDITEAIPKVAPVVQQLGGDVKDLAFFMTAMKEGGVQASEGANALKSGLARLINPTKAASEYAASLGINLRAIIEGNAGDLRTTMLTFSEALKPLDDLQRARLLEKVFGKYQFARISALFDNLGRSGTQAERVLRLTSASVEELALTAEKELGVTADSAATKLAASMEKLRVALVPIGEAFAQIVTPIADFITKALDKFNSFSDGTKRAITAVIAVIGGIGPVLLMTIGLVANGIANILKFINLLRKGYQNLTIGGNQLGMSTNYLSMEQLEALSVANNLHMAHELLTDQFALEAGALARLTGVYQQATAAAARFAGANSQFFVPGAAGRIKGFGKPMAKGGWVPGTGNKDTVPAVLMPGEFVVKKDVAQSNKGLLESMNKGGGEYRGMGTPAFGKVQYRKIGTPQSADITSNLQTASLHLRSHTPAGQKNGEAFYKRYSGYTILGGHSFNQLTQNDPELRRIMQGKGVEGYPLYYSEAQKTRNHLASIQNPSRNQKVALAILNNDLKQFPNGNFWKNEMGRRYALATLAAEGLDPNSPEGKALYRKMKDNFSTIHSSSKNSNKATARIYALANKLHKNGTLSDAGMKLKRSKRAGKKMLPKLDYKVPLWRFIAALNDPNFVVTGGTDAAGRQIPSFFKPEFKDGKISKILGMDASERTQTSAKVSKPQYGKVAARQSWKWGSRAALPTAAMGILGVGAAQALQNRAGGTPAYGEQGITPALLTPGEFVMNARSTQANGAALQSMNAGGFVKRQQGTESQRKAQMISQMKVNDPSLTSQQALRKINEFEKALGKTTERLNVMGQTSKDVSSQQDKAAQKAKLNQRLGTASMLGFAVAGGAQAVSMTTEGRSQEIASQVANVGFAISTLAIMLPLFTNPLVLGVAAVGGIAASLILYNKMMKKAADDGYKAAQALGVTSDELQKVSESTGAVSLSQVGQRQRESRMQQFTPIESDFGTGFIESDAGKMLLEQVKAFEKAGTNSAQLIGQKLATYVSDGLMTAAQAESVASELGRQLRSQTFAVNVSGTLQSLIGFNGVDLKNNPMEVRVRLVEETQGATSNLINQTAEDLDAIAQGGAFYAVEQAAEQGAGFFGQMRAAITGIFSQRKMENELAGEIAGSADLLLETTQNQIDAGRIQFEQRKLELDETEKILNAELASEQNADRRSKILEELGKLDRQRAFLQEDYTINSQKLLGIQTQQFTALKDQYRTTQNQDALLRTSSSRLKEMFKGTAGEGVANELLKATKKFDNQELTYTINTLVTSGQLGVDNASKLLQMFTDETELSYRIDTMVDEQNLEGLNRAITALTKIEDNEQASRLFKDLTNLDKASFDQASVFLETASGIPEAFMNLNDVTASMLTGTAMSAAGEDINRIKTDLADIGKLTEDQKAQKILDFVTDDTDFNVLQDQANYFSSLSDDNVKQFLTIFRTISMDYDPTSAAREFLKQGNSIRALEAKGTEGLQSWWLKNVAVPLAKRFQELLSEINIPGLTEGGDDGAGGGALPVTTMQLMELRMKGLDPAAASELDFSTAAAILNASVAKQKKAIQALNGELRVAAIQSELLKTDQEILNDTLKATNDTIGAYIDMIESTRIKPIQDQIDKFNELSNTQQDQIEQYQRGIQQLSDKEDEINKIYDERIDAIDKVTQANERAADRQQRQIDLASAIASGDFAAAAAAQADITASEAGYQLEDARASLEQRRQEELKNLTIEINGQIYTREQLENNIKNLEEEIYQRTLLVRQEQEKIAAIEKEITLEKEKQRKIQVLQQMSQLAQQMATTVNPQQRQLMASQIGLLGQSVGISDVGSQAQFNALGQELGINLGGISATFSTALENSRLTAEEFENTYKKVLEKTGKISQYMDQSSVEAGNALQFISNISRSWGDSKNGIGVQGLSIQNNLIGAADSIRIGRQQIDQAVGRALSTISRRDLKMYGGKIKKFAMGGNINYKGSNEPAPVRMAIGNVVPGLGNTDRVPALLTPGEFVVRKSVAQENMGLLQALNGNVFPQLGRGMSAASIEPVVTNNIVGGTTMYNNNYNVNVNVAQTDTSATDIANVVVRKIKTMNDRELRGSRY